MATRPRKISIIESGHRNVRGVGMELIPLTDDLPVGMRRGGNYYWNRANFDSEAGTQNQIAIYEDFKLSVLKDKLGSEQQDILANIGEVSAAKNAYISTCSTHMTITPGPLEGQMLYQPFLTNENLKQRQDQIFDMIFRRGGAVVEMKFERSGNMWLPIDLVVHDPRRFDFEQQPDPRVTEGARWVLGLSTRHVFERRFERLDNPAVRYIAYRPKAGKKPFGTSRVSPSAYYAAILVQTLRLVTKILSRSGTPVLPITIDKQKLFGGNSNMTPLYEGDIDNYVRDKARELRQVIPKLSEGDALILTGECVLGDYLAPGESINLQGMNEWQNELRLGLLWATNTPPAVIGLVQKGAAIASQDTQYLIKNYKNECRSDQELVASSLQSIIQYGYDINNIRLSEPVKVDFEFSNPEEQNELLETSAKRAAFIKETVEWITAAKEQGILSEEEAAERFEMEIQSLEMM